MNDFLKFFAEKVKSFPMTIEITNYQKPNKYSIIVWTENHAGRYSDEIAEGDDVVMCSVLDSDIELAFAKAHTELKLWFRSHDGGY